MSTFMDKGENAFRDAIGDSAYQTVLRKRSDSRLKDHESCTDLRAWSITDEPRRLYLIDLIKACSLGGTSLGKYIPIEVIIDVLVDQKCNQIGKLTGMLSEYERLYGTLKTDSDGKPIFSSKRGDGARLSRHGSPTTKSDTTVSYSSSTPFASGLDEIEDGAVTEYIWENDKMNQAGGCNLKKQIDALAEELNSQRAIAISAIKMLETLKQIVESDEKGLKQIMPAEKPNEYPLAPCNVSDILAIKEAIQVISSSQVPGLDQDPEVITQKLTNLITCCDKLTKIVEDNEKLKKENEFIRNQLLKLPVDEKDIQVQYGPLQQKLTCSMQEMNNLKQKLTCGPTKPLDSNEVVLWRERSEMLNDVIEERDSLKQRLEKLAGLEEEVQKLKNRAAEADTFEEENYNLTQEIRELQKYRRISNFQEENLESLRTEHCDTAKTLENIRAERDTLARKATEKAALEESLRNLTEKHRLCQCVKEERDSLKARLLQYGDVDDDLKTLREKADEAGALELERDRLLKQVQELSTLQAQALDRPEPAVGCRQLKEINNVLRVQRNSLRRQIRDMDCVISDQEDEIKALIGHIENYARGQQSQKETIRSVFTLMQAEIDRKNAMLSSSNLKLTEMENLTCNITEMEEYYQRALANLKKELAEKQSVINILQSKLEANVVEASSELVRRMSTELEAARKENDQAEELINEIKRNCGCRKAATVMQESQRTIENTLKTIREQKQ